MKNNNSLIMLRAIIRERKGKSALESHLALYKHGRDPMAVPSTQIEGTK